MLWRAPPLRACGHRRCARSALLRLPGDGRPVRAPVTAAVAEMKHSQRPTPRAHRFQCSRSHSDRAPQKKRTPSSRPRSLSHTVSLSLIRICVQVMQECGEHGGRRAGQGLRGHGHPEESAGEWKAERERAGQPTPTVLSSPFLSLTTHALHTRTHHRTS